jgi:hypothetical protein
VDPKGYETMKTLPATQDDLRPVEVVSIKAPRVPVIAYADVRDCLDGSESVASWLRRHGVRQVRGVVRGTVRT